MCVSRKAEICIHVFENVLYSHNLPNKNAVKLWYSTLNDSIGDQFDVCAKNRPEICINERKSCPGVVYGKMQGNFSNL